MPDNLHPLLNLAQASLHRLLAKLAKRGIPCSLDITVTARGLYCQARLTISPVRLATPSAGLSEMQSDILEALADDTLIGPRIAELAGYPYNSHMRGVLAAMRRRGLLHNDGHGYYRPRTES